MSSTVLSLGAPKGDPNESDAKRRPDEDTPFAPSLVRGRPQEAGQPEMRVKMGNQPSMQKAKVTVSVAPSVVAMSKTSSHRPGMAR